jgi:DNA repair protein RecN (Recombination protein N)
VDVLTDAGRVEELSRMLAGLAGSESGLSHAEELLAEAERVRVEERPSGRRAHARVGT